MMRHLRRAVVMLAVVLMSPAVTAAVNTPEGVVRAFQDALLDVWKQADELTPEQRYDRLEPAMTQAFDLRRMIQVASGPAWAKATEQEQQQLEQAFQRYSVSTYASRFSNYNGQSLDIAEQREGPRDFVLVDTQISKAGGETVPVTYVLSNETGVWQIVDVIFKGVSEMAVRRSDYRSILKSGGPEELAARLQEQSGKLLEP